MTPVWSYSNLRNSRQSGLIRGRVEVVAVPWITHEETLGNIKRSHKTPSYKFFFFFCKSTCHEGVSECYSFYL